MRFGNLSLFYVAEWFFKLFAIAAECALAGMRLFAVGCSKGSFVDNASFRCDCVTVRFGVRKPVRFIMLIAIKVDSM